MSDDNAGWSLTESFVPPPHLTSRAPKEAQTRADLSSSLRRPSYSDPSVFTALLQGLGVKGLQVEDLWSMEDEALSALGDIKWVRLISLGRTLGGVELEEETRGDSSFYEPTIKSTESQD